MDASTTPTLRRWAKSGGVAELAPTFPCVTSPVQASMLTGATPREHGVVGNGFYHRERDEVEFWVAHHDVVAGEPVWDAMKRRRPDFTTAVWHYQNIKGATADFIVTPAPIHEPDGTTRLWCYSKPDGFYAELLADIGHFPLQHYWGPLSNMESTRWILHGARRLIERHAPNLHLIYLPHLDYAAQKFGPDSPQARTALVELDAELASFAEFVGSSRIGATAAFLVAGEYAMTAVSGVVHPNRLLRQAGLLAVREEGGAEHVDLVASRAFAMVDHQFAHVYVKSSSASAADPRSAAGGGAAQSRGGGAGWGNTGGSERDHAGETGRIHPADAASESDIERVAEVFRGVAGVAGVYAGRRRADIGLDHPRSGEIVLVAREESWFAYPWWLDDRAAPAFARTVDIHRKPGYDPVELFFDPATRGIPLDATLVKGSHGAPASSARQRSALILSSAPPDGVNFNNPLRDIDVKGLILALLSDEGSRGSR